MQADFEWADQVDHHIQSERHMTDSAEGNTQPHVQTRDDASAAVDSLAEQPLASSVESIPDIDASTETGKEAIHVLRFSKGKTDEFRDGLLNGRSLNACRDAMARSGYPCVLPSGAFIFVKPDQYRLVQEALCGIELHPYHVIISDEFEFLLDELLAQFPYKARPREKPASRQSFEFQGDRDCSHSSDRLGEDCWNDAQAQQAVSRTFLCYVPMLRDSQSVVQSTTEVIAETSSAHYSHPRGVNPRRMASDLIADRSAWARMLTWRNAMKFFKFKGQ